MTCVEVNIRLYIIWLSFLLKFTTYKSIYSKKKDLKNVLTDISQPTT